MPFADFFNNLGVLPLRAIAFQSLLLLVAIVLEAIILRQRLRLGYRPSIQFAATLNLLATSLGWLIFLSVEPFTPEPLRTQMISYILFNHFYVNTWADNLPFFLIGAGLASFFATLWIKLQGLTWLLKILGITPKEESEKEAILSRKERYDLARRGRQGKGPASPRAVAILEANAVSFTAILLLLLLRNAIEAAY